MPNSSRRPSISFAYRQGSLARSDSIDSLFTPPSSNFVARLRARKQSLPHTPLTPAEAVWFIALPDKVRRQHFTKEEQILMRARSEIALIDTSAETLAHVEEAHIDSSLHMRSLSVAVDGVRRSSQTTDAQRRSSPRRWRLHNASPTIFSAPDYSARQPTSTPPSPTIRGSDTNTIRTSIPASPDLASLRRPSTSRSMHQTAQRAAAPPPIDTNKPLYVRDPNTMALLRDYLSADRLEETMAFGFPAAQSATASVNEPWLDSTTANAGNSSASSSDDTDLSSADEVEPPTPDCFIQPRIVRAKPMPQFFQAEGFYEEDYEAAVVPDVARNPSNISYFEELMSRDMTLRMTLTKPELRASNEHRHGAQAEEHIPAMAKLRDSTADPLALEELTFSEDTSGLSGPFAQMAEQRKKGIRGLLKR